MKKRTWILYLAFRYLFPQKRFGTFFTWISTAGILAGVTLLTVVLSIMNGFDENIAQKLIQINGPIKILSPALVPNSDSFKESLKKAAYVKAVTPFAQGITLLQHFNRVAFPKCIGFDPQSVQQVLPLQKFVEQGNLADLSKGAFVSAALAKEFDFHIGDTVDLYSPMSLEAIKQEELILPQEVPIVGIFKTGWADIDRDTLLLPLSLLQELYGLGNQVHGYSVEVDRKHIQEACTALNAILPPSLTAYTWHTLNKDFLYILRMEKAMCFFVLLFVVMVAAFSMSSGLMTTVVRKQREIALLQTLGATQWDIALIFSIQSMLLGALGTVLGFLCAYGVLSYRNTIVHLLTGWFLPENALWDFYSVETLPVAYSLQDFAAITFFSLLVTFGASLFPVIHLKRLPIMQHLRGE